MTSLVPNPINVPVMASTAAVERRARPSEGVRGRVAGDDGGEDVAALIAAVGDALTSLMGSEVVVVFGTGLTVIDNTDVTDGVLVLKSLDTMTVVVGSEAVTGMEVSAKLMDRGSLGSSCRLEDGDLRLIVTVVVLEYEDVGGAEGSRVTVVVLAVEDAEVVDESSCQSFHPDQPPCTWSCRAKSSTLFLFFRLTSSVSESGPTQSCTTSPSNCKKPITMAVPGSFFHTYFGSVMLKSNSHH